MHHEFKPSGVCPSLIQFDLENDIVKNVKFSGGCPGNLKAIPILLEGMSIDDVIKKLTGITCNLKPTSCVDQLTKALIAAKG